MMVEIDGKGGGKDGDQVVVKVEKRVVVAVNGDEGDSEDG